MSHANTTSRRSGFTLVEMLIIAPIALLVITGFVALMVTMVGDVIVNRSQNVMTYDIQSALNTIERDVRLSTEFLVTSGPMLTPQGRNGATTAFTTASGDLILGTIATNKNPIDPTRSFVHYKTPNSCGGGQEYQNRIFFITVIYTVRDGSLWRRTYVPSVNTNDLCKQPWQVNTCAPGYATATRCQANDSEVLKNIKGTEGFKVKYYTNPEDTIELAAASATTASSISVTLEGEQTSAGRTVSASSTARATKLSSREVNLAPPSAPTVTGSSSGRNVVFSWPSVPTATSYIVQYNVNGGDWAQLTENTTETTISIPANHGDTVSVKVRSRNTTGVSNDTSTSTASATVPLWHNCGLQNSWKDYKDVSGGDYSTCGYTMTKSGVVMLKGLIAQGTIATNITLFQLPEGYRPANRLVFRAVMGGNQLTRLNVEIDGKVTLLTSGTSAASYLSLEDVRFMPNNPTWTNLTLQNGWTNYGSPHAPLQTLQDSSGRVHIQGIIKQGTYTANTIVSSLPSYATTSPSHIVPTYAANGSNFLYLNTAGNITPWGTDNGSYTSIQASYYPSSYTNWQTLNEVTGTPTNGQMGNGWTRWSTGFPTGQYTKAPDGMVSLRGLMKNGTLTNGTVVAVLPPGYRPSERLVVATLASGNFGRFDILPNGQIVCVYIPASSWTSIDNIHFMAEG